MSAKQPEVHPESPVAMSVRMPSSVYRQLVDLSYHMKVKRGRKGHRAEDPASLNSIIVRAVQSSLEHDELQTAA